VADPNKEAACRVPRVVDRPTPVDSWQRAEVENEGHFRDLNEWTRAALDDACVERLFEVYLCECGDESCADPITLPRAEYELVRSNPTHFALATNHENPKVDFVIVEHPRYTIVEKGLEEAAQIAYAMDPRR
jgi:hypothetical protein